MAQIILESTGDWEKDKQLLKQTYGTKNIPSRTVANMIDMPVMYVYWLAKTGRLGSCHERTYNFLLPQLIDYIEHSGNIQSRVPQKLESCI